MSGPVLTDTLDTIAQQTRRVRRRWNARVVERTLCLAAAVLAAGATGIVLLALWARPRVFVAAAPVLGVATLGVAAAQLRAARGRWLGRRDAALVIDRRAGLEGRLATLAELGPDGDRFFLPLLVRENLDVLSAWRPARIVPRVIPRGALGAALAAAGALALAITLGVALRPPIPKIVYADHVIATSPITGFDGVPERVVVTPNAPGMAGAGEGEETSPAVPAAGQTNAADDRSPLARLASAFQDRIRAGLWGDEWKRAADAMQRAEREAETRPDAGREDAERARGDAAGEQGPWEEARAGASGTRRQRGSTEPKAASGAMQAEGDGPDGDAAPSDDEGGTAGASQAASGAGSATNTDLYGQATDAGGDGGSFPLGITARMRAQGSAPRRPSGETPPAEPDAGPALAARPRPEAALQRASVPPAYEAIVRAVFAHGEGARP